MIFCSPSASAISALSVPPRLFPAAKRNAFAWRRRSARALRGVLYVLDEPSIGLHARDNDRLLHSLEQLRNLGNTVLVVEHDEDTIRRADYVVDLGPGAGNAGGYLVATGKPEEICARARFAHGTLSVRRRENSRSRQAAQPQRQR